MRAWVTRSRSVASLDGGLAWRQVRVCIFLGWQSTEA
jgi:hypothetical protein